MNDKEIVALLHANFGAEGEMIDRFNTLRGYQNCSGHCGEEKTPVSVRQYEVCIQ
jgi:hypothetical protein